MVYTCICGWTYIIGLQGWVYGPIFEDWSYDCARIMYAIDFQEWYADCAARYYRVS